MAEIAADQPLISLSLDPSVTRSSPADKRTHTLSPDGNGTLRFSG